MFLYIFGTKLKLPYGGRRVSKGTTNGARRTHNELTGAKRDPNGAREVPKGAKGSQRFVLNSAPSNSNAYHKRHVRGSTRQKNNFIF